MRIVKLPFFLLITLILGGCASLSVNQDYEPGTDLSIYTTFGWKSAAQPPTGDIRLDNPLLDARIREAVTRALTENGYREIDQGSADFLVEYGLTVQPKIYSPSLSIGTGVAIGGGGSFGGIGVGIPVGGSYEEGVLVIDLYDTKTGQHFWRGSGATRLNWQEGPEKTTKEINTLVEKILAQFPPPKN
jgi:hypothetical protein